MSTTRYIGTELEIFAHARNWKGYLRELIAPYLHGRVLEVGGGIGATTCAFRSADQIRWTVVEPDEQLARKLRDRVSGLDSAVQSVVGTLSAIREEPRFECVLYIDVLEHIEDDRGELAQAAARLAPGGALVVLTAAHQSLYTPFDAAIGHYRRYNRKMLRRLTPHGVALTRLQYCDSAGVLLTLGNRLVLRSASPAFWQVRVWDAACIPVSRFLDPLLGWRVGKSVLAVWHRPK